MALKVAGVEPRMHDYCRGWVWKFLGFIKPAKFSQAELGQVEGYLQRLTGEGKEIWQARQAEEAVLVFYRFWGQPKTGCCPKRKRQEAHTPAFGRYSSSLCGG